MRCADCTEALARYEDPREPPLDTGKCLCKGCYTVALDEEIGRMTQMLKHLKYEKRKMEER